MKSLNTEQLETGMVVALHGSRFRLTERHQAKEPTSDFQGYCVWFRTEYLGPDGDRREEIPEIWRHDWIVQGNRLAYWPVEN